jgi:acetyl-CoA carboxylase biotin carboxyl carrier protein
MADKSPAPGGKMQVDTLLVKELAQVLDETRLTEIEVQDGERRIRVARTVTVSTVTAAAPAAVSAPVAPVAAAPVTPAPADPGAVKSPMVGTVYLSPEPGAPNFVAVGKAVKAGDTLVIIEAMKVMNPITTPKAGTVTAVLVQNEQPVEYDTPLVIIG